MMRQMLFAIAMATVAVRVCAAADEVPEDLMNAFRICNAHATAYEPGHPTKHNEWHHGYEACAKIEPYVRKLLAPSEEVAHRAQAEHDREALRKGLSLMQNQAATK